MKRATNLTGYNARTSADRIETSGFCKNDPDSPVEFRRGPLMSDTLPCTSGRASSSSSSLRVDVSAWWFVVVVIVSSWSLWFVLVCDRRVLGPCALERRDRLVPVPLDPTTPPRSPSLIPIVVCVVVCCKSMPEGLSCNANATLWMSMVETLVSSNVF